MVGQQLYKLSGLYWGCWCSGDQSGTLFIESSGEKELKHKIWKSGQSMGWKNICLKIPQTVGGLEIMVRVWEFLQQTSLKEKPYQNN